MGEGARGPVAWLVAVVLALVGSGAHPQTAGVGEPANPLTVAVLPLGLSAETAQRYPQLARQHVGLGVHNMISDRLYDTGRFRLIEDKPEVIKSILERQWVAGSGLVSESSAIEAGKLLGARYVIYGEVYDLGVNRHGKGGETRVALQVRLVDAETGEYVPASGRGMHVIAKGDPLSFTDEESFARSTVGQATEQAISAAVDQLINRLTQSNIQ